MNTIEAREAAGLIKAASGASRTGSAAAGSKRPLVSGMVYCHGCHGHGRTLRILEVSLLTSSPTGKGWRVCQVCGGEGQLRRERFGVRNPESQGLAGDAVRVVKGTHKRGRKEGKVRSAKSEVRNGGAVLP